MLQEVIKKRGGLIVNKVGNMASQINTVQKVMLVVSRLQEVVMGGRYVVIIELNPVMRGLREPTSEIHQQIRANGGNLLVSDTIVSYIWSQCLQNAV